MHYIAQSIDNVWKDFESSKKFLQKARRETEKKKFSQNVGREFYGMKVD